MGSLVRSRAKIWIRRGCLFLLDLVLILIALRLGLLMRYDGVPSVYMVKKLVSLRCWILLTYATCLVLGGHYQMMWRYAGSKEYMRLVLLCGIAAIATLLMNRLFAWRISRPVLCMTGILTMLLIGGSRIMWKMTRDAFSARSRKSEGKRALIVGAGEGGVYAARICRRNPEMAGIPVAFVDDNPMKLNMRVSGLPVMGTIAETPEIVRMKGISDIIIAAPSMIGERLSQVVSICRSTQCRVRMLNDPNDLAAVNQGRQSFRELNTSDFLSRSEVRLDEGQIRGYLTDRVVLVTGGGGSIGSEICRQVMRFSPKLLVIFDIYENCAYDLENELRRKYGADCAVKVLIGSIRDKRRLDEVFVQYHPQVVFHAAAHKHVPLMEVSPVEAVKNNVFGTRNLLQSASTHGVERLVQLSTDKAVNPTNVMGATKRVTEMLIQTYAAQTKMICTAVRFGNVLGSHGSVIPLFEAQIRQGGPVTLTDERMTRYFMTISEAAQLVLQAGGLARSGSICVLDMGQPVRIKDLAEQLIRFYGYTPGVDMEIKIVGLRPGEKLYEELLIDKERNDMEKTTHDKIFVARLTPIERVEFENRLARLYDAAKREDEQAVLGLLRELVPTYQPNRDMLAG
ncbi:MAG: nucleoside-diphosphate sugar epimerase/dehydratase [Eubacteriales bacterium]|nr:nucleoside-diphosphate sugar epimerase/dehydratase [Eubacteriales bacterium]